MRLGSSETGYPGAFAPQTVHRLEGDGILDQQVQAAALYKSARQRDTLNYSYLGLAAQTNVFSNGIGASIDQDPLSFCSFLCVL